MLTHDDYIFFWKTNERHGWASQWYPSPFAATISLDGEDQSVTFPSAEHWMMVQKALLFSDNEVAKEILEVTGITSGDMASVKALGRKVSNFNDETWNSNRDRIVLEGNLHKFRQNPELKENLLATGEKAIVEASPRDRIWGVGFGEKNALNQKERWGLNLLALSSSSTTSTTVKHPPIYMELAKAPAPNVWNARMEQRAARATSSSTSSSSSSPPTSIPPSLSTRQSSATPAVKVQASAKPTSTNVPPMTDKDSWPDVTASLAKDANGGKDKEGDKAKEQRTKKAEKTKKWVPIPAQELQAAADAHKATTSNRGHSSSKGDYSRDKSSTRKNPPGSQQGSNRALLFRQISSYPHLHTFPFMAYLHHIYTLLTNFILTRHLMAEFIRLHLALRTV
ncbi:hypothetical protein MD484_g5278, partial [Candolleomyces efflorescens]